MWLAPWVAGVFVGGSRTGTDEDVRVRGVVHIDRHARTSGGARCLNQLPTSVLTHLFVLVVVVLLVVLAHVFQTGAFPLHSHPPLSLLLIPIHKTQQRQAWG